MAVGTSLTSHPSSLTQTGYIEVFVLPKHTCGFQYKLGDFQVRVGKCVPSASEALRGIMMEVEYIPLSSIDKSRQVLEEFFDIWQETISKKSLPGHFMHIESNFTDYGLQDRYTSHHTAVQYATCMAQLIAAVRG
ncbi:hypothetical protein IEQ34_017593 [Dendrobium chrysotoxum]|uniref:Mediator of RNA polymerase II transcription subunit 20 n=1 Tax=Dendrobium chrysotoxum TaxID=161865 RepID=A0AAV7FUE8_DENCH|nr:hypothetical protein IEQ34_017593 [Dendrobium chrysotoxum]